MSSSFYSTTATNGRKAPSAEDPFASGSIRPDIDPGPNPRPLTKYGASIEGNSSFETGNDEDDGKVHIVFLDGLSSSVACCSCEFHFVEPEGKVEELIGSDLSNCTVGAAENCERGLSNLVNTAVLYANQRSVSKPWVSEAPYAKNACIPDLNLLSIDSMKLEGDFLQAVLWWRKVLNQSQRSSITKPAFVLALYNTYLKLSDPWMVREAPSSKSTNNSMDISYDGPKSDCSKTGTDKVLEADHGNIW
ncbi:hypothetical protein PanWU01x14_304300 [Parasponia andersonii]|uniref:Uncharacterized protein n=1 Tax=Parasponia andersonii TaxID=3476 RepID=A0A2P5ASN2_PARAD|nr:hypothetical protein PanWU01x14_304300 [Parasponia andersonii]